MAIGFGVAILAVGIALFINLRRDRQITEAVHEGPIIEAIYAIGTVEAVHSFQVKAGVAAIINDLRVVEGTPVKKGDLLVSLSEGFNVRAPFDGVVTRVNYKLGESVFAGNVIAEMMDPEHREIKVVLDQRAAIRVARGQNVRMSFDGLRDQTVTGKVRSVFSSQSRFTVMIDSEELPEPILPGMAADISIEVGRKENVILLPVAALDGGFVTRVRDGRKEKVSVKTGLTNEENVEILEGDLHAGDSVLIKVK